MCQQQGCLSNPNDNAQFHYSISMWQANTDAFAHQFAPLHCRALSDSIYPLAAKWRRLLHSGRHLPPPEPDVLRHGHDVLEGALTRQHAFQATSSMSKCWVALCFATAQMVAHIMCPIPSVDGQIMFAAPLAGSREQQQPALTIGPP